MHTAVLFNPGGENVAIFSLILAFLYTYFIARVQEHCVILRLLPRQFGGTSARVAKSCPLSHVRVVFYPRGESTHTRGFHP